MKSLLEMSAVVAIKPAVLTLAPFSNTMPLPLTRMSRPFALTWPAITDAFWSKMRFKVTEAAFG